MIQRPRLVYGLLAVVWVLVVAWQVVEHDRFKKSAQTALLNRSRDITTTLGLVIRSQRRFGGVVSQERLESALSELVKSGALSAVALVNASGEVVSSAGPAIDFDGRNMRQQNEQWDPVSVTVVNLVDLGATVTREGETNRPTIVLPRRDSPGDPREDDRPGARLDPATNATATPALTGTESPATNRLDRGERGGRRGGPRFGRPFGMDEAEYKELLERRGLHGVVVAMSTEAFRRACRDDLWMRWIIGCFAGVSVIGLGLAWRNLAKSSDLQMRLLRASELNSHLKEMNLAAAGLAHETRNPLNIIRGLAQMISKQNDASAETRRESREIIDETDRVTAQLNEFINYSRPREVRRAPVALNSVVAEVVRALNYDLEEKQIRLEVIGEPLTIEGDEQLLRQSLFNLVLNAIQAVEPKGEIQIVTGRNGATEAFVEVRDNGKGVVPENRLEIFKPYFTTQQKGTGLGLAVVQQITLAHGWEIECLPNEPSGAIFRTTHLKISGKT
jgi:signal transduction histidine kinase